MRVAVQLDVTEEVGVPRTNEIVRCGVPWPAATVTDPTQLNVLVDDQLVAHQVLWAERDGDGFVRWVGLAFPVTVDARGIATVSVIQGGAGQGSAPVPPGRAGVQEVLDGVVRVSTGVVTCTIGLEPFSLSSDDLGIESTRLVLLDGSGGDAPAVIRRDGVTVTQAGPLIVEVELRGRFEDPSGHPGWGLVARVRANAGAMSIDVETTVINDVPTDEAEVAGWSMRAITPSVKAATLGVFGAAHRGPPPLTISHRGEGHARGIFALSSVAGDGPWEDAGDADYLARWEWAELHGLHAQNWVILHTGGELDGRDLTLGVHRFAENHPSDIAVGEKEVEIRLWPQSCGGLSLTEGAAKTRRHRWAAGAHRRLGAVVDSPLVPALDPVSVPTLVGSALPRFLPYLPEELPNLESHIREELSSWYQSGQSLGFHDYGDSVQGITTGPRTGYSANNEHDALLALTLHYLRSGERVYYDSAEAYADHLCDTDLIHSSRYPHEVGGLRAHGRAHVHYVDARTANGTIRTSIDTGHMWTEGLVLFGQISGDLRYLDAARQVGDCLVGLTDLGWTRPEPGPRNAGWPLIALTALAHATGDSRYLGAAQRTAARALAAQSADGRWMMRLGLADDYCAWQNAVLLVGLTRLRQIEDSADLRSATRKGMTALLDLGRNRDGTFVYLGRFDYRWANRSALVREALALAFEETGDERFLRAGLAGGSRWYRPRSVAPALSNDVAEWRGHLPFLASAHAAGLLSDLPDA